MKPVLPNTRAPRQIEITLGGHKSIVKINSHDNPSDFSNGSSNNSFKKDLNTAQFFLIEKSVLPLVQNFLPHNNYLVCPSGESCKTQAVFETILQSFFDAKLSRLDCVAVIGGGALCDVGGFAVSIYMRGLPLIFFPTTLLSMVDASIGGKTAINYNGLKNMVGSFYPAHRIFIYPHFLSTLPITHLHSGLAEVLKAGMLYSTKIISLLETHTHQLQTPYNTTTHSLWEDIIWEAIKVKVYFIESDFTERATSGAARIFLNLGHTFAHAIEAQKKIRTKIQKKVLAKNTTRSWEHGNAVALGIRSALLLGRQLHLTSIPYTNQITSILDAFSYPSHYPNTFFAKDLIACMKKDKKNTSTALRFVLQHDVCKTFLQTITEDKIITVLQTLGTR